MPMIPDKGLLYTQPYYDTVVMPAAAVGATFFAVPIGGALTAAIAKTARHTNLVQAGRLELGNELQITAISMHFPVTAEAGALPTVPDKRAARSGNIRLIFGGDTEFLRLPAAMFPNAGAGEVVVNATVALNDVQNGTPVTQNKFYLEEPITLRAQESISLVLENCDAITAPTEVTFVLWGTSLRPVR